MTSNQTTESEKFKTTVHNEDYLYSVSRNTFVQEPSINIFKRHFDKKANKEASFYLILGTDSGLLLNHVIQQEPLTDTRYLFIEPPHIINKIREKYPENTWPENIRLTTPEQWQQAANEFDIKLYVYKNNFKYLYSIGAIDAFDAAYSTANVDIEKQLQNFLFFTRTALTISPFFASQLHNICENKIPAKQLTDSFAGKTCIVLAGGPSLDENIDWIKANQENLFIIAVSRIAKNLLKKNLIPHAICSVDPYEISFDVSKEMLKLPNKVLFIHSCNVTPLLLSQWQGRSVYLGDRLPWQAKNQDINLPIVGPTVTNTALQMALVMGFDNILLAGVDLCYSEKGITHASGSNEAKVGPQLGQQGTWVETYAGNTVETLIVFEQAAQSLASLAKDALKNNKTIYNISSNAAKIDNITYLPVEAISFDAERNNFWANIDDLFPQQALETIRADNNTILKQVTNILSASKAIHLLAKEALTCNEKLFQKKGHESDNFRYKLKMDKIEHKINSHYKKAAQFIKNYGLDKFILSAHSQSSEEWSDSKIEETGHLYYQAYINTCTELIPLLETSKKRILSRIEEEKNQPNLPLLFNQWQRDNNEGRALVWKNKHLTQAIKLNISEHKQFESFLKSFNDTMLNENTAHLARTTKENSLVGVRRKIITLFKQKNTDALETLSHSLALQEDEALSLYHLSLAYYYLALNHYQEALSYFEKLPIKNILEDELQQITNIAFKLSDYTLAQSCLKQLSQISTIYLPKYAKLLELIGENNLSIQTYNDYLLTEPDDLLSWNALGKLYFNNNAFDAAKMAFEHVINQESNNIIARDYLKRIMMEKNE